MVQLRELLAEVDAFRSDYMEEHGQHKYLDDAVTALRLFACIHRDYQKTQGKQVADLEVSNAEEVKAVVGFMHSDDPWTFLQVLELRDGLQNLAWGLEQVVQ